MRSPVGAQNTALLPPSGTGPSPALAGQSCSCACDTMDQRVVIKYVVQYPATAIQAGLP